MSAEQYVKKITAKLKCDKKKKNDIKRQLLAEIEERKAEGERLGEILEDMGSVKEVANDFNESLSSAEIRRYRTKKVATILGIFAVIVLATTLAAKWYLPRVEEPSDADKKMVEALALEVIDLIDADDYEALAEKAIDQMKPVILDGRIPQAKAELCNDWGARTNVGSFYMSSITQKKQQLMVCQVNVGYENVSVTYTVSFDDTLHLSGLYMK